ncbi:MAG TPA: Gfo/Idh/MocA family oxidoreductase [bacterium]|uniref:1,5-anhydro-D-fructose reductase n=1 Tax=candidate division TA06 bacterium ADurb.Bin417 TaxID=1852828 RepID=A0A1V5MBS7_UNCT6|nr:MAG: 1,5-anhydro-D-fructose reductase [candidate division TA06 bacterium ADurb.Bin417]HNQ35254.1 Gfo/Idh/MocA family oxidoreductase [bacterium]HNS48670.1 Gfo/Idh/MocA family oxidoreductase [bacterium]
MKEIKTGVIGCGNISGTYLKNFRESFPFIRVEAVSDLDRARAEGRAAEFGVPRVLETAELLADPELELVVNLTVPAGHGPLNRAALEAGKHVYCEKPLALDRETGLALAGLARSKNLRLGGAPDTFLGAGYQTARRRLDEGLIGVPVAATAFMVCRGHESWHPAPDFYYKPGGGPLFDMGPYYLTALVYLLGPVARVTGLARASFPERTITSQPDAGQKIKVEVATHIIGGLEFASGALATLVTSFDVWGGQLPRLEVYGSEGSLSLPDPNRFAAPILHLPGGRGQSWSEIPLDPGYTANSRGLGTADLVRGLFEGRPHLASGELALHVLDIMQSILEAAASGRSVKLATACERPGRLDPDFK